MEHSSEDPTRDVADAPVGKVWEEQGTPGRPIDRAGETVVARDDAVEYDDRDLDRDDLDPDTTEGRTP